jgi:hypothetical protein
MSYTLETKKFEENMEAYEKSLKTECRNILKKSSVAYGERAARYVPPMVNGKWSKSIPAKLYKRQFVAPISALIKHDTRNRQLFHDKLREGYRFAIKGILRGKVHWWFATTLRKSREYVRIFNRGLFKFLFGANFGSIGEKTPAFFQRLLTKSPNLSKHAKEHILELKTKNDAESIRIVNDAWGNQAFARESKYQGEKAARQSMKKQWKEWNKNRVKV